MKILTGALLIGILSSITFGSYISSKDTRCRSECRKDANCPLGFSCKAVSRDGCRLVYECIKEFISPIIVDHLAPIAGLGEEKNTGDLQIINVGGNQIKHDVFPSSVDGRGGAIVNDILVTQGVQGASLFGDVGSPAVLPLDSELLQGGVYSQEDVKVVKDASLHLTPMSTGGGLSDGVISLGMCIDNCLARTTCLQGTDDCRLTCKNICLKEQSTIGIDPVINPIDGLQGIGKPFHPVDKKVVVKTGSNVNKVKVISPIGSVVHGSGLEVPIVNQLDSLTGQTITHADIGDSVANQHGLSLREKVILNANSGLLDTHVGQGRTALVGVDSNLHQADVVVAQVNSRGIGSKTVIVDPPSSINTHVGVRQVVNEGGFINAQGHLGQNRLASQNVRFVDPVLKRNKAVIGGSTLIVDDIGHLGNAGVKAVPRSSSLDILIPTKPRDCFKECNRDTQCGDFENGICRVIGCKRVCEYPTGSLPTQDRQY